MMNRYTIEKRLIGLEAVAKAQVAARPVPVDENRRYEILAIIGSESLTVAEAGQYLTDRGYRLDTRSIIRIRELLNLARARKAKGELCRN